MTPYASLDYFLWAAFILVPGILLGLLFGMKRWVQAVVTLIFLATLFWGKPEEMAFFAGYTVWQYTLIWGYAKWRHLGMRLYVTALVGSLIPLVWVKLVPILHVHTFIGFLGISYLSFKSLQIIIELRDGQLQKVPILDFLSFLWFYPTISSGPIDRFRRFTKDTVSTPTRKEALNWIGLGIERIFRGLLYKFMVGYWIQTYWMSQPLLHAHTLFGTIAYMYAYSFYLFFDFAGYSAFAVGFSYLLGIQTPENFNKPFLSRNMKDFWNRWHMTLSHWFRDYVYMRLVMGLTRKKVFRNKYATSYVGYFALFGLMGLWHGLQLHYIVYGIYHAVLMIAYDGFERWNKRRQLWRDVPIVRAASILITFHLVCFGFLIFSGRLF